MISLTSLLLSSTLKCEYNKIKVKASPFVYYTHTQFKISLVNRSTMKNMCILEYEGRLVLTVEIYSGLPFKFFHERWHVS